jgi:hypothetical protein
MPSVYFPFLNLVFYPFTLLTPGTALIVALASFTLFFLSFNWQGLARLEIPGERRTLYTLILGLMSYPYLMLLDRGNTEIFVFTALALFLVFYLRERYVLSALFLAAAASMKIYPAVFGLLFLCDRKYKEAFIACGAFLLLSVVALFCFQGGFVANLLYVLNGFGANLQESPMYAVNSNVLQRSTSLFTLFKWAMIQAGVIDTVNPHVVRWGYFATVGVLFLGLCWYVVFREQLLWRKAALLVISYLLLPTISADYRMIHLFIPLVLFFQAGPERDDYQFWVIFGLLLIPKAYYFMSQTTRSDAPGGVSEAVIINPLLLIVMAALIIYKGLKREMPSL